MEKTLTFRGAKFILRDTGEFLYLYPPEGIETRNELQCFSPTEIELSDAIGEKVECVDIMDMVTIYARIGKEE